MSNENYEFASDELVAKDGKVPFEIEALGFPGFYESVFWNNDNISDDIKFGGFSDEFAEDLNDEEVDDLIESIDRDAYEHDVSKQYMNSYIDLMNFISEGLIETVPSQGVELYSPKAYNYSTDRVFQMVMLDIDVLKQIHQKCMESESFKSYLKDNFTPQSGWMPLLSDNVSEWSNLKDLDTIGVNVLLQYYTEDELRKKNMIDMREHCTWEVLEGDIRPLNYIDNSVKERIKNGANIDHQNDLSTIKKVINVPKRSGKKKGGVSL